MVRGLAIFAALVVLATLVAADLGQLTPFRRALGFPYADKVGHLLLFGILSLFVHLTAYDFLPLTPTRSVTIRCTLILTGIAALEEFSQIFLASRTASLSDLIASSAGIGAFGILASWIQACPDPWGRARSTRTNAHV